MPGILLGCKSDLEDQRVINYEDALSVAQSYDMKYIETSSKDNINVTEGFQSIIDTAISLKL